MIVQVHSAGSLWQQCRQNATFNSTGVDVGGVRRSRAKTFGQVRFPSSELHEVMAAGELRGSNWESTPLDVYGDIRKLHLMKRAGRRKEPELHLVTVTDELVGWLDGQSWSSELAQLVSWSESQTRLEVMFLMKPSDVTRAISEIRRGE